MGLEARHGDIPGIPWNHSEELPPIDKDELYQNGFLVIESGDVITSPLIPDGRLAQDTQTIVTYVTPDEVLERLRGIPQEEQGNEVSTLLNYVAANTGSLVMISGLYPQAQQKAETQIALTKTLIERVQTQFPSAQITPSVMDYANSLGEKLQALREKGTHRRPVS